MAANSASLACPSCGRTFSRQEHRDRHLISHTNLKPFTCALCNRRFARRDVHQRHMRLQHSDQASLERTRRTRTACDSCHGRKIKCRPVEASCERCLREGSECSFTRASLAPALLAPDDRPSGFPEPANPTAGLTPAITLADHPFEVGMMEEPVPEPVPELPDLFMQTQVLLDFSLFDQLTFPPQPDLHAPYPEFCLPPPDRVSAAYARLHEFSMPTDLSRPPSPTAQIEHEEWIRRLGSIQHTRYDPDVVDVFLNLFRIHVVPTFRCFEELFTTDTTPEGLGIAMAGVGGLYCSTPGAVKVAKSMYNSIRIKLLSKVHHQPVSKGNDRLATLQLYMLLELFGYLSGDERLLEIAEVYHWEMVQIVEMYNLWSSSGSSWETERKKTIEGICILECYRVAIFRGSATFNLPLPIPFNPTRSESIGASMGGPEEETLLAQLQWMASGQSDSPIPQSQVADSASWTLSCLSLLLPWAASGSNLPRNQFTSAHWHRRELLESVLNKWSTLAYNQCAQSTQVLFHIVSLNLHVNLRQAHGIASSLCAAPEQTQSSVSVANVFPSDVHRLNGVWHATRIIRLVLNQQQQNMAGRIAESPHFAYSVFFAGLTLWCDMICSLFSSSLVPVGGSTVAQVSNGLVAQAMDILSSSSSAPITTKLLYILGSLPCGGDAGR